MNSHHPKSMKTLFLGAALLAGAVPARSQQPSSPQPAKNRQEAIQRIIVEGLQPPGHGQPFPSYDPKFPPPDSVPKKDIFALSQDYPALYDVNEDFPWMKVNFRQRPMEYLRVVLDYCIEGMEECGYAGQKNKVRKWYHVPWQHDDGKADTIRRGGREYLHGMTMEKDSDPGTLHVKQTTRAQTWATGFYNQRGGHTIGRVFQTAHGLPDPTQSNFPANTVTFKLLFTDAPVAEAPFLANSLKWQGNIYESATVTAQKGADGKLQPIKRVTRDMHLLQIDVAIKDPRVAGFTGWIFGTFIYDGGAPGKTVWERMTPVGLSWGDDSSNMSRIKERGAFHNEELTESRINVEVLRRAGENAGRRATVTHLGLGGRLNGPVDNPISSCVSCHGRAGTWAKVWEKGGIDERFGETMPFIPVSKNKGDPVQFSEADFRRWFKPIGPGPHLEEDSGQVYLTTDYSLQVAIGIRNFYQSVRSNKEYVGRLQKAVLAIPSLDKLPSLPACSRDGDERK